jgi:hypothetical protein
VAAMMLAVPSLFEHGDLMQYRQENFPMILRHSGWVFPTVAAEKDFASRLPNEIIHCRMHYSLWFPFGDEIFDELP